MKEEGNRKKRLTELIIKAIPEEGNIKRSELMRQMQSTMDPGELKICFNQAIERKRLREEKIGDFYYVSKPAKSKINYTNEL